MKGFGEAETKILIDEAVRAGETGESLTRVFERIAAKTKKARGSVRNYYYNILKNAERDENFKNKYKNVSKLKAERAVAFSDADEKMLLEAVAKGKRDGKSTRKAIYDLALGDEKLALRYQNKYRNLVKSGKVESRVLPVRAEDFKYFTKLSVEIDGLISRIKDKYALECLKLKAENDRLEREIEDLKKQISNTKVAHYFLNDKNIGN